jgi:hypothetical protein
MSTWKSTAVTAGLATAALEISGINNGKLTIGHFVSEFFRWAIIGVPVWVLFSYGHITQGAFAQWILISIGVNIFTVVCSWVKPLGMFVGHKAGFGPLIDGSSFPFRLSPLRRFLMWYFWMFMIPEQVAQFMSLQMLVEPNRKGSVRDFHKVMRAYHDGSLGDLVWTLLNSPFPDEYDDDVQMDWTRTLYEWEKLQSALDLGNDHMFVYSTINRDAQRMDAEEMELRARRAAMEDVPESRMREFTINEPSGTTAVRNGIHADPKHRW